MKKALVVMLLFLGLSLTGCGTNNSSNSTGSSDQQQNKDTQQTAQKAEDPAAFYKGKVINWIVPFDPGGGYDVYSRMLAPFFEKYTGATVIVKNVPGAGSLVGTNQLYETKDDGLTVGITNNVGLISAVLSKQEGASFDLAKFTWLGRIVADAKVVTVGKKFTTDAKNLKSLGRPFKVGATGKGSSNYLDAVIVQEVSGIPMDIVTGFGGSSEVDLSIARGELDGSGGSYSSRLPLVQSGDQKMFLLISGEIPEQVPALKDLAVNDEALAMLKAYEGMQSSGRAVVAPPGIPEARANFLKDAFKKAMEDPEFVAQCEKGKKEIGYASGDEVKTLVTDALSAPPKFVDLLKENIK